MEDEVKKDFLDTILDDAEKGALEIFASNATAVRAVKKMLLASVYHNGTLAAGKEPMPLRNAALSLAMNQMTEYSNEHLGADLRALASGVSQIEMGFDKIISKFKQQPKPETKTGNKGR